MTKKQKQLRRERRRRAAEANSEHNREQSLLAAKKRQLRRAKLPVERFYAPPNVDWIMVMGLPQRGAQCVEGLNRAGLLVFEGRTHVRFVNARGRVATARIPTMRRVMFVGIRSVQDLEKIERCEWVGWVLSVGGERSFRWVPREGFRSAWVEAETFGQRRMPTISPGEMQRFADFITGRAGAQREEEFAFLIGMTVRVKDGPFATFTGTVAAIDAENAKYKVNVNIFGKSTPVDLEEDAFEAA